MHITALSRRDDQRALKVIAPTWSVLYTIRLSWSFIPLRHKAFCCLSFQLKRLLQRLRGRLFLCYWNFPLWLDHFRVTSHYLFPRVISVFTEIYEASSISPGLNILEEILVFWTFCSSCHLIRCDIYSGTGFYVNKTRIAFSFSVLSAAWQWSREWCLFVRGRGICSRMRWGHV